MPTLFCAFFEQNNCPFTCVSLWFWITKPHANSCTWTSSDHSPIPTRTLRVSTWFHAVQQDPPLFGCYYGDASWAKTKAEQKTSSLRQEPLAELWQPNQAWLYKLEPPISVFLCLLFWSVYSQTNIDLENILGLVVEMKGREFISFLRGRAL